MATNNCEFYKVFTTGCMERVTTNAYILCKGLDSLRAAFHKYRPKSTFGGTSKKNQFRSYFADR